MRVVHVIDSLAGSGGAEQGLVREITRFGEGIEQMVALLFDRRELAAEVEAAGIAVKVVGLAEGTGSRTWPSAVAPIRRIFKGFRPDVIQTSLFLGNLVGQIAGRSLGVPVVSNLVLSGDVTLLRAYQPGAGTRRAGLLRTVAGIAARGTRVWFRALTEEVRATNAELLGVDPGRITVIPRGVPVPDMDVPRGAAELGLPEGPLVVNVGRHAQQKGQVHLIEAFAQVLESVPQAHLVIVGREGPATGDVIEAVHRTGIGGSVTLAGHTDRVGDYLAQAHVFAFPSVMEGLGTAVIEAMACGVPVVAFDIPPVREATGDGAHARLVPVGDVEALAEGLVPYLQGDRVVDFEGRDWVRRRHDLDRVAADVEGLLRAAASGGQVKRG
jgi:glycosyltransferase involved in cell wall biosynthesis